MVEIRLMGTRTEIDGALAVLDRAYVVVKDATDFYPNHGDRARGRVFVHVEPRTEIR